MWAQNPECRHMCSRSVCKFICADSEEKEIAKRNMEENEIRGIGKGNERLEADNSLLANNEEDNIDKRKANEDDFYFEETMARSLDQDDHIEHAQKRDELDDMYHEAVTNVLLL